MIGSTVRSGAPVNSVEVLPTGFDQTAGDAQFMAHSKIKVLVVEDETLVRLGIAGRDPIAKLTKTGKAKVKAMRAAPDRRL